MSPFILPMVATILGQGIQGFAGGKAQEIAQQRQEEMQREQAARQERMQSLQQAIGMENNKYAISTQKAQKYRRSTMFANALAGMSMMAPQPLPRAPSAKDVRGTAKELSPEAWQFTPKGIKGLSGWERAAMYAGMGVSTIGQAMTYGQLFKPPTGTTKFSPSAPSQFVPKSSGQPLFANPYSSVGV